MNLIAGIGAVPMLGPYESATWKLGRSEGTEVVAVVFFGYHRQVVTGKRGPKPPLP